MEKPSSVEQYVSWSRENHHGDWGARDQNYYDHVTAQLQRQFEASDSWQTFINELKVLQHQYVLDTLYQLLPPNSTPPSFFVKPFNSVVNKCYRKNVLQNLNWPEPPEGGWITPENVFSRMKDIIRTAVVVRYLDGVEKVANCLQDVAKANGEATAVEFEARDDGYYASHINLRRTFEVSSLLWDTVQVEAAVEIQITTQAQELIKQLTHEYYERRRVEPPTVDAKKWQWDYKSEEFVANYLGHILHYLEGMILEVRDRRRA